MKKSYCIRCFTWMAADSLLPTSSTMVVAAVVPDPKASLPKTAWQWRLLRAVPPAVLPLSLMSCNFGGMWSVAAATNLGPLIAIQPGLARLSDVMNAVAVALQMLFILRCALRFFRQGGLEAFCKESQTPPFMVAYSTSLMALFGIAAWIFERGLLTFAIVVWVCALLVFFGVHALFVRVLFRLSRSSPRSADDGGAPPPSGLRKLFAVVGPPWIVPLVGLASAAATGGGLMRASTADLGLQRLALLTPLALGAVWALVIFPSAWAAVLSRRKLCTDPTAAILCAPPSLLLAGLLGAEPQTATSTLAPLAHLLVVGTLLSTPPVAVAMPARLLPTTPFNPGIAACGFPMEIAAIALLRYRANLLQITLVQGAAPEIRTLADIVGVLAWIQLTIATLVVLAVFARFLVAAWRAAVREKTAQAAPAGEQSAAAAAPSGTASGGSPPAATYDHATNRA